MIKFISRLDKVVSIVTYVPAFIASFVLLLMVLITVAAVVMRKVMTSPIIGMQEYSEMCLFVLIFLFLSYSAWTGSQIAVDLIGSVLKGVALRIVGTSVNLASAVLMGVISWQTFELGVDAGNSHVSFNITGVPHEPFYYLAAVCCALYVLVLVVMALRVASELPEVPEE